MGDQTHSYIEILWRYCYSALRMQPQCQLQSPKDSGLLFGALAAAALSISSAVFLFAS